MFALAGSCIFMSVAQWLQWTANVAPVPWEAGVKDVQEGQKVGSRREDFMMPEVNITEKHRTIRYSTTVGDSNGNGQDFPMGAPN